MCFSAGLWVMGDGLWVECILGLGVVWVCVRDAGAKIGNFISLNHCLNIKCLQC